MVTTRARTYPKKCQCTKKTKAKKRVTPVVVHLPQDFIGNINDAIQPGLNKAEVEELMIKTDEALGACVAIMERLMCAHNS